MAGINSQFDGQKNDKDWAGNAKEYFGMGGYKPEALKAQADLELQRTAALRAAAKGHAHAQTLDGIRQQSEAVRAQRMMIEQTKLDHETEILKAQGIDISQPRPPVPQLDPSGAVQPEAQAAKEPDAGATDSLTKVQQTPLGFFDKLRDVKDNPAQLVPFGGAAKELYDVGKIALAAHRVKKSADAGEEPSQDDILAVKTYVDHANRDTTFGYKVAAIVSALPAFASGAHSLKAAA